MWIPITSDDRLEIIKKLPSRWPEVVMARERGDSLEKIATWAKCPPPCDPCRFHPEEAGIELAGAHIGPECLSYLLAECYNKIESDLFDLSQLKAKWMA